MDADAVKLLATALSRRAVGLAERLILGAAMSIALVIAERGLRRIGRRGPVAAPPDGAA